MAQPYRLNAGDKEIFKRARNPTDGIGVNWFLSYYFGGREMREWQWYFHHASQKQISVVGGCISGDTILEGQTKTIKELVGQPIEVLAWTGTSFGWVKATAPFYKGRKTLYKVTLDDGRSIKVTDDHRFLTDNGYKYTSDLAPGHLIGVLPIQYQTTHVEDAPHCWQTVQDSQDDYRPYHHLCDAQPRENQDNAQWIAPSSIDAQILSHSFCNLGDPVCKSECTHPCLDCDPLSMPGCENQGKTQLPCVQYFPLPLSSVPAPYSFLQEIQLSPWCSSPFLPLPEFEESENLVEKVSCVYECDLIGCSNHTGEQLQIYLPHNTPNAQQPHLLFQIDQPIPANQIPQSIPNLSQCTLDYYGDEDAPLSSILDETNKTILFHEEHQGVLTLPEQTHAHPQELENPTQLNRENPSNASYNDNLHFSTIVRIEPMGVDDYYDLHVPKYFNYVAHGMVNHNTGSGKTSGAAMSYAAWAATTPNFQYMNLAPTAWQSTLQYREILTLAADRPFEKFIWKYAERPYPRITLKNDHIGESTMWFMSAADDAERIQGINLDAANLDECGVLVDGTWLLTMLVTRLRGTAPLPSGGFRPRLKRLSTITANYDFAPPWYWSRMDMMFEYPEHFLSMIVQSSTNLSDEDIKDYKMIIPKDKWETVLEGKKPEGEGIHFSIGTVTGCENWSSNRHAQYNILEKEIPTPEWDYRETTGAGCVHYEEPSEFRSGRQYLLVGDPGKDNPPNRNSGVIMCFDTSDFPNHPAKLVYFDWVAGNGSYDPFIISYSHAWNKYKPYDALIDSTGTQSLWNEQILFDRGIWATGMNFSTQKKGMLVSAMRQAERHLFEWPYIQGIRSQLLAYDITDDEKLPQDIVATLMMTAYYLRQFLFEEASQNATVPDRVSQVASARDAHSRVWTARTAGIYNNQDGPIYLPQGNVMPTPSDFMVPNQQKQSTWYPFRR